jgi:phosphate starvation-inducible membrane PsiE
MEAVIMHHTQLNNLPPLQMAILCITLVMVGAIYFLPTIIAIKRNSPHASAVVILNFFFGFTFVGWIVALLLASKQPQPIVVVYGAPPPPR